MRPAHPPLCRGYITLRQRSASARDKTGRFHQERLDPEPKEGFRKFQT